MTESQLKVLIIEDEALVAMLIEDMLVDLGHEVVGVGGRVQHALRLAQEAECDLAIIDLNLNGERTNAIAQALATRGVPFIFATGYGPAGVDADWRSVPVLQKPFEAHQLRAAISAALR